MFLWDMLSLLIAIACVLLVVHEFRACFPPRLSSARKAPVARRFLRRSGGVALIVLVLALLRFPPLFSLSAQAQSLRLTLAFVGIVGVFAIAVWDLRAVSRQCRMEMEDFTRTSARKLRESLNEAARAQAGRCGGLAAAGSCGRGESEEGAE